MLAEQQRGAPRKLVEKKPEPKPTVTEADNSFVAIYARAGGAKSEN